MVTETTPVVTDEAAVTPAPTQDAPATPVPETDWKAEAEKFRAEAETAKAQAKKAENDRKAEAGRVAKAAKEASELQALRLEVQAIREGLTEKADIDAFVAQQRTAEWRKTTEAETKAEASRVWRDAADLGVDPNDDDAFEDARDYLAEAAQAVTEAQFHRAMKQSRRAADTAIKALRDRKAAEAAPKPEAKPAAPEKPKGPSAEDIARTRALEGIGAGVAAGGMSDEAKWTAYGRGEIGWSKDVREAGKRLGFAE